jgi:hypothetical protein
MNLKIHYLFSSNQGDIPVEKAMLERPFVAKPLENHPFLTLRDFFEGIRDFVWQNQGQKLARLLKKKQGSPVDPGHIEALVLRYEKYGTLYHVVSVEAGTKKNRWKFALSVAQYLEARETLDREFQLLHRLNKKYEFPYIPRAYFKGIRKIKKGPHQETFLMALCSWFEGYHEWHFQKLDNHAETALIWDMEKGYHCATKQDVGQIIRQASRILTLYFDPNTFHHIDPWHHGAGDFVVKKKQRAIEVRLITVRGYEPMEAFPADHTLSTREALFLFFLEMTIKMRLDKSEGMGSPLWASPTVIAPVLDGFVEALRLKEKRGDISPFLVEEFFDHLRRLSEEDLYSKMVQFARKYRHSDPVDFACIHQNLEKHVSDLYKVLHT